MTMFDDTLFDAAVADFLEADPTEAPPQVLRTVLAALPAVEQRGSSRRWGGLALLAGSRFGLAAGVLIAAIAVGTVAFLAASPHYVAQPSPSPSLSTVHVPVPAHGYAIDLPIGWSASLGEDSSAADAFSGPAGRLAIRYVPIPAGTAQDAWLDTYLDERATELGPACFAGRTAAWDAIRVGPETGEVFRLTCNGSWMVVTAVGNRGYDLRFSSSTPSSSPSSPASSVPPILNLLLQGITFDLGPLATSSATSPAASAPFIRGVDPGTPLPDAFLGDWYVPGIDAFPRILRGPNAYCIEHIAMGQDCSIWQIAATGRVSYDSALTILDGKLAIHWFGGSCPHGSFTYYAYVAAADRITLHETGGGCSSGDLVLVRPGTNGAPSLPPPAPSMVLAVGG